MRIGNIIFTFLCMFFFLQLIFAKGGIISFIGERSITNKLERNVESLKTIKKSLTEQSYLAHTNKAYITMNAHRVGLLSENEYLIRLDTPIFSTAASYTPGIIIQDRESFFVSIPILFFSAFIIMLIIYSIYIIHMQKNSYAYDLKSNMSSQIKPANSTATG